MTPQWLVDRERQIDAASVAAIRNGYDVPSLRALLVLCDHAAAEYEAGRLSAEATEAVLSYVERQLGGAS